MNVRSSFLLVYASLILFTGIAVDLHIKVAEQFWFCVVSAFGAHPRPSSATMLEFVLVHRGICTLQKPGIMPDTDTILDNDKIQADRDAEITQAFAHTTETVLIKKIGGALKVVPDTTITQELADKIEAIVMAKMGQIQSCSWLRCPFNDGPIRVRPPEDILTCTGCRHVRHVTCT